MGGHNPKLVKRKTFPRKERKSHMHGCKGAGCKKRVVCNGILSHTDRCPPCADAHAKKVLFAPTPTW